MSGKRGVNRQSQGCRSRFFVAHLKIVVCKIKIGGVEVIFPEFVNFSLI